MDNSIFIKNKIVKRILAVKNDSFIFAAMWLMCSVLITALSISSCDFSEHETSAPALIWVGTWGTAQQLVEPHNMPPAPGLSNNTLRQVVCGSIGGEQLRMRFSNEYSTSPVTLKEVHIAVSTGGSSIDSETDVVLRFDGKDMVTIEPGKTVTSDSFNFTLKPRSDVAITIYFGDTSPDVTGHPGSRTTSFLQSGRMIDAVNMPEAAQTDHWYIIDCIEVLAPKSAKTVVVIGDSITDGRGSGTNKQDRWPDELAERLREDSETSNIAVLNMGIGGNCMLRDCLGSAALTRFKDDVLGQNGVHWVIILEGINDIGQAKDKDAAEVAKGLIKAYERMIDIAHEKNIFVYGATLLPFEESFYYNMPRETARQDVNEWIRTGKRFDAVIDLDKALSDPENPIHMLSIADTGDHLHPNETGHKMMAEAVDLKLFKTESAK